MLAMVFLDPPPHWSLSSWDLGTLPTGTIHFIFSSATCRVMQNAEDATLKYQFKDFVLDTDLRELKHREQTLVLTKQAFDLLHYLVTHPDKIHSKDDLVTHVWQGRIVSDNTVDQSISKLRKILNSSQPADYIEVVYGQGVKFVPEVQACEHPTNTTDKPWRMITVAAVAAVAIIALLGYHFMAAPLQPASKPKVLMLTATEESDNWAQGGAEQLFTQVLNYAGLANVVELKDKPRFVDNEAFISNQKSITPSLRTIETELSEQAGDYVLTVTVNHSGATHSERFEGSELSQVMSAAMAWLGTQLGSNAQWQDNSHWLPGSSHVAELYLRAMDSLNRNEIDKARKQLDLIKEEAPEFYLAPFQMAHVLTMQNQHEAALAQINTLLQLPISTELQIGALSMKANIFDTLGQHDEGLAIFEEVFATYPDLYTLPLLQARYEYSYLLLSKNMTTEANQQLDTVISHLNENDDVGLLADALALKGSIQQRLGQVDQARELTEQALAMFERNDDALGMAKSYTTLARMANQQANYGLAEAYLKESLAITQTVGFKLGEGATLNELTYTLMVQGQHNQAWELARELEKIAAEIDYPAMQMAAKQLFFDMAREQKKWAVAEKNLQQHHEIAQATNNKRALIKNHMLALSLWVDAQQPEKTTDLIATLQAHIDQQQEVRMQPRLDWFKARILLQQNQPSAALDLLQTAKSLALINEDGETIININNTLARMYLDQSQPDKALDVLQQSSQFKPFALPYLKLLAETQEAMGEPIKALETMNLCQQQAADLWTDHESSYLAHLVAVAQNQPTSSP